MKIKLFSIATVLALCFSLAMGVLSPWAVLPIATQTLAAPARAALFGLMNAGSLASIDTASGEVTTIGFTGFQTASGLAADRLGWLYTTHGDPDKPSRQLIKIDPSTGIGTAVSTIPGPVSGLAFDASDTLFGVDWSNQVVKINTLTGDYLTVGQTGIAGPSSIEDIAFSPSGVLFGVTYNPGDAIQGIPGSPPELITINTTTGFATVVGTLEIDQIEVAEMAGIAFDSSGTLFGVICSLDPKLATIDPVTCVITEIASLTNAVTCVHDIAWIERPNTVGGQITSDTTWTKANSPYIVTGSVLVNTSATLTIEPGVAVKFDSAKGLQINGQLIARGTEAEPITFTSNQPTPAPGDWVNVLFTDSSVDASYDAAGSYISGSIMQYCTIEYTSDTVAASSCSPYIDHCTITNGGGISVTGTSPRIANCTISRNSVGILVGGGSATRATISGNAISWNSGNGIHIDAGGTIEGNTIANNSYRGINVMSGTLDILNNTISSNQHGGINVWAGTVVISGTTISDNVKTREGDAYYGGGGIGVYSGSVTIVGNAIQNNTAPCGGGIDVNTGTSEIIGNTITGNSAEYGGGVRAGAGIVTQNLISSNSASQEGGGIHGGANVSYNIITGNSVTGDGKGGGICASGQPEINYNNIHGNTPYDVYNANSQGSPDVDRTNNWWGTTDEPTIQAHIWDWSDDASLGIVDYVPYLTGEVDITPPTIPVVTDDGASTSNNTQLHASWTASQDLDSGVSEYQYAMGTTAGATDVTDWTSVGTDTEVTKTGLNLAWGTTYYFSVKARNGSGMWSDVGKSDGITVSDSTPPTTPVVTDDGTYTTSSTQLHATWTSGDTESGIAGYECAIGTSAGGTDVVGWTSTGATAEVTKTELTLTTGTKYYTYVRAKNGAGTWSAVGTSDGITVYPRPQAAFSASSSSVDVGQEVVLTDESVGAVTSWVWDFGDGVNVTWDSTTKPANGKISHMYSVAGTYVVSLTVSNPAASNTRTEQVTVRTPAPMPPQSDFSAQPAECAEGKTITFTSLCSGGTAPLTYAWDFDNDGTIDSTDQNPTHSYANSGTYAVSLKVTDIEGNTDTETKTGFITVIIAATQQDIPTQGGTIQTTDGQIAATFPADAVTSNLAVTIKQLSPSSVAEAPKGFKMGTTCFTIEAVDTDGSAIVTFSQLVTITVKYTDEDVEAAGGNPSNLVLAYYDEAVGKWQTLDTTVNTIDKTLSATTTHLSTWATMAKAAEGNGVPFWIWITVGVAAVFAVGLGNYLVGKRRVAKQ